jgi:hypothetical protein
MQLTCSVRLHIGAPERHADGRRNGFLPNGQVRGTTHLAFTVTPGNFLLDMADAPHLEQQLSRDIGGHGMNQ